MAKAPGGSQTQVVSKRGQSSPAKGSGRPAPKPPANPLQPSTPPPIPLAIAHRGASSEAPENTLAAFLLALCSDVDGCELDLRPSPMAMWWYAMTAT